MERHKIQKIVLDSSVVIKWFSEEEGRQNALELRFDICEGRVVAFAPDLQFYEVANALKYNPEFSCTDIIDASSVLLDTKINYTQSNFELISKSVELAYKYSITVYDASFVALALLNDCQMITADKKLYEKVKQSGHTSLLGDT